MVILVKEDEFKDTLYGEIVFNYLKANIKHDDKYLKISTNLQIGGGFTEINAFNTVLRQLRSIGDTNIIVKLNK